MKKDWDLCYRKDIATNVQTIALETIGAALKTFRQNGVAAAQTIEGIVMLTLAILNDIEKEEREVEGTDDAAAT